MGRKAEVVRNTKETQIRIVLDLDGSGESKVSTGIGFFDHMLESFARHGGFDLKVTTKGDINLVTEADIAAENLIIDRIRSYHPQHGILAEE